MVSRVVNSGTATMSTCRICGNSNANRTYIAREMMYGYRDEFEYFQCSSCGCLQIKEVPKNLSKYYPPDYYSFSTKTEAKQSSINSFFRRHRLLSALGYKSYLGSLLLKAFGAPRLPEWVRKIRPMPSHSILDVGCGAGHHLLTLRKKGFSNLMGVDPYIKSDIFYKNGVRIFKKELRDINEQFDFIRLSHCFEHIAEPLSMLKDLYRILKPHCYILIAIPLVDSYAWRKYGVNWAQLDAPRHLFLHSVKSMTILAETAGFQIEDIVYDSTSFQFTASELYKRNVPLNDQNTRSENPDELYFSTEDIEKYEQKAKELNDKQDGDQAQFYLFKKSSDSETYVNK